MNSKIAKLTEHWRDYYLLYGMMVIVLIMIRLVMGFFAYISIYPGCWITLNTSYTRGNEESLRAALDLLSEDSESFGMICEAVDSINERDCLKADAKIDPANYLSEEAGCFIKGSHTIYIKPETGMSPEIVRARAAAILKYSGISREYWLKFAAK